MNALPPPSLAPAGWYPDPVFGGMRYFDGRQWAPPPPQFESKPEHATLPVQAAIGALVVLVGSLVLGRLLVEALIRFDWPVVVYIALLVAFGYGPSLVWVWYVRSRWAGNRLAGVGWTFKWGDLWRGPVTWLTAVATQLAMAAVVVLTGIPLSSNVDDISDLGADRAYMIASVVAAVVAAPIVEELIFRGIVMRGLLSRLSPALTIAVQGVLFGVAHVDPVRGVGNVGLALVLSGVGIALGASAYLCRRIGPTVVAHAIFNAVVMAIVLSGLADDGPELGGLSRLLG